MKHIFSALVFFITLIAQSHSCYPVISENDDPATNHNITEYELAAKILSGQFKEVLHILRQPRVSLNINIQNQDGDTLLHLLYHTIQSYPIQESTYKELLVAFRHKNFNPYIKNKDGLNYAEYREHLKSEGKQFKIINDSNRILQSLVLNFQSKISPQQNPQTQKPSTSVATTPHNYKSNEISLNKPLQGNNATNFIFESRPSLTTPQIQESPFEVNLKKIEDLPSIFIDSAKTSQSPELISSTSESFYENQVESPYYDLVDSTPPQQIIEPDSESTIINIPFEFLDHFNVPPTNHNILPDEVNNSFLTSRDNSQHNSLGIRNKNSNLDFKQIKNLILTDTLKNIEIELKTIIPKDPEILKLINWVVSLNSHLISRKDRLAIVTIFLDLGANPNSINKDGNTILYSAHANKHSALFKLLLDYGAKWDIPNKNGKTMYEICNTINEKDSKEVKLRKQRFKIVIDNKISDLSNQALKQNPITIETTALLTHFNQTNTNDSKPFNTADEVKKLLSTETLENIEVILKTIIPQNPYLLKLIPKIITSSGLSNQKRISITKIFLDLGANVNLINSHGNTLLYSAYVDKNTALFKLLLEYGADWNIPNKNGKTIYELCNANDENKSSHMQSLNKHFKKILDEKITELANQTLEQSFIPTSPTILDAEEPYAINEFLLPSPNSSPEEPLLLNSHKRTIENTNEELDEEVRLVKKPRSFLSSAHNVMPPFSSPFQTITQAHQITPINNGNFNHASTTPLNNSPQSRLLGNNNTSHASSTQITKRIEQ